MKGNYVYNTKTHTLHIYGFCTRSEEVADGKYFDTINEVIRETYGQFILCDHCGNELDKEIRKIVKEKEQGK